MRDAGAVMNRTPRARKRAPNLDPKKIKLATSKVPLIKLDTWRELTYATKADAPCIATLRRWAKAGLLSPPAVKQGRSFYVVPTAVYKPLDQPAAA